MASSVESNGQWQLENAYGGWNPQHAHGLAGWGMELRAMLNSTSGAGPNDRTDAIAGKAQAHKHEFSKALIDEGIRQRDSSRKIHEQSKAALATYKAKDQYDQGLDSSPSPFNRGSNAKYLNDWATQRRGVGDAKAHLQQALYSAAEDNIGNIFSSIGPKGAGGNNLDKGRSGFVRTSGGRYVPGAGHLTFSGDDGSAYLHNGEGGGQWMDAGQARGMASSPQYTDTGPNGAYPNSGPLSRLGTGMQWASNPHYNPYAMPSFTQEGIVAGDNFQTRQRLRDQYSWDRHRAGLENGNFNSSLTDEERRAPGFINHIVNNRNLGQ